VIVDAARYFGQAKYAALHGAGAFLAAWGEELPAWTDLPLVPLLDGLVLRASGESRTAVQAFTTLLFAGTVVVTGRLGKALWDEEVGFLAAALLLAIPYLLVQVPAFLVDVPTMFFLALALLATVEACLRGGAARTLAASLAVTLACFSKYSTWLLLSAVPVAAAALRAGAGSGADRRRPLRAAAAVALVAAALVGGALLARREVFLEQLSLLLAYQAPGLRRWGESLASTFLFQIHPFLTAAALASAAVAARRRDARWAVVAWPVLLLVVPGVRRIRYLLPAFPMLALMAAYGLRALPRRETRKVVVACAVGSALVVALYGHLRFLKRTSAANLMDAGAYLDAIPEDRVEAFTRTAPGSEVNQEVSVPILDLFTTKRLLHRPHPPSPPAAMRESALRFTWEHRTPAWYAGEAGPGAAVVVISGEPGAPPDEELAARLRGLRLARRFTASEEVFRHATFVDVYRPAEAGD
jgi:4-amino-4-deoxy-L-arabinose transferase-like glycosyltransferase